MENELKNFEVKRLPYGCSLGFLLKVYSASDPSGYPVASVVERARAYLLHITQPSLWTSMKTRGHGEGQERSSPDPSVYE